MTSSYQWICEYLPNGQAEIPDPEKLGKILTAIGLEVESLEKFESVKGGLKGLVIGEVIHCEKHPDADKLTLTKVDIGAAEPLQIVCGAPNVAVGQKVVVATIGSTIYPSNGEPMTMKKAKIRGAESQGMICAEDEIGLGESHAGILVLPADCIIGMPAAEYFKPYEDHIYEIGLTPNRIDAMSHLGVARDVCAYLSHHNKAEYNIRSPYKNTSLTNGSKPDPDTVMEVTIENAEACQRYAGIRIDGVTIAESPAWLQQKLKSIGLRPINNIVDITNFILHETGQPLHAFDAAAIPGSKLVIKNLPEGTPFITLDEKPRKLSAEDLMICSHQDGIDTPVCMAGVYGGLHSGVSSSTKNIFLESAWFHPTSIRKTSIRHQLRTDAATRFEKGVDISQTVQVLKRAALLIKEITGGTIHNEWIDVYPSPKEKTEISLKFHYLKKLSGKNYHGDTIKNILSHLGFELLKEGADELRVSVPYSKPDVTIPADIVEEIMRIDGLDNVEIPNTISIAPAVETLAHEAAYKEKIAEYLSGSGFHEIFTNSITNSAYYNESTLTGAVKMINSLSETLDVMRPSMLETGLESVAYNLNRKNNDLQLYEFGKTYGVQSAGKYIENNHLAIFISGKKTEDGWKQKAEKADHFFLKAVFEKIMRTLGLEEYNFHQESTDNLAPCLVVKIKKDEIAYLGLVKQSVLDKFDIRQPVYYADINWDLLMALNKKTNLRYAEISKYPAVQRDLAIVVDQSLRYENVEKATLSAGVHKLRAINLFDVFESDKLGPGKKSMAVSFTFSDDEKTLTDKEIDSMMGKIIASYEKELQAEIRK